MGGVVSAQGTTVFRFVMGKTLEDNKVLKISDYSGSSSFASYTPSEITNNTCKFTWNSNTINYSKFRVDGLMHYTSASLSDYYATLSIAKNYYITLNSMGTDSVVISLRSSSSGIDQSDVTWSNALSSITYRGELICNITVSSTDISAVNRTYHGYTTMLSSSNISNGNIYVNQDGQSVYLSNDTIDVDVVKANYTDLSNDNGDYTTTVTIDSNRSVYWTTDYMDFITGYSWLDDSTLILKMDVGSHTGSAMINTNYNEVPVVNNAIAVEKTDEGIICKGVNEDMQFSMLITITG